MVNNIIVGDTTRGPFEIVDSNRIRVLGGYVDNNWEDPNAEAAPIRVRASNDTIHDILIESVTARQNACVSGLHVVVFWNFLENVAVRNCYLVGNGTNESAGILFHALHYEDNVVTRRGISVTGNVIKNNQIAVALATTDSATKMSGVNITGNTFFDDQPTPTQTTGVLLKTNSLPPSDFIEDGTLTISANTFGRGITTTVDNLANVDRYAIGGQGANNNAGVGGTMWWVRTGAPTFNAPNGDTAIRADGGSGSTFYVREGGSWVAK